MFQRRNAQRAVRCQHELGVYLRPTGCNWFRLPDHSLMHQVIDVPSPLDFASSAASEQLGLGSPSKLRKNDHYFGRGSGSPCRLRHPAWRAMHGWSVGLWRLARKHDSTSEVRLPSVAADTSHFALHKADGVHV